jgi:hypothetical protein
MSGALHHGTNISGPGPPPSHAVLCISQGSGFVAYAIIMSIMLLVGEGWIRRKGKSPEFYDSLIITLWVCPSSIDRPLLHAECIGVGYRWAALETGVSLAQALRLVNTFTEHRGNTWSVKDMQHT